MKLSPCQAPLYGECVLTVQLCDEALGEGEQGEVQFFLLFTGSAQRHLTSTLKVSHATLQAVCPAHNCCEWVLVTLCSAGPDGNIHTLATERLHFVQDLAFDMAQFLVSAVGQTSLLEEALLLDEHQIPLQECKKLDQNLSLALKHITLPPGWNLLRNNTRLEPQETLLHFAARRGLLRVARFLLKQPGAREALNLSNKQGATPVIIAQSRGYTALLELFSLEDLDADIGVETLRQVSSSSSRVVQHHPSLNTYTLSLGTEPGGAPPNLQTDILELRRLMLCHCQGKGGVAFQQSSDSPHIAQECDDGLETRDCCCEEAPHDSLDTREREFTPFSTEENKGRNDRLDPSQNREGNGGPSLSCESAPALLHNGNSEDQRACACENSETDCREQEERSTTGVVSTGDVGDSSDGLQSGSESIVNRTSSCEQQKEEADKADDLICEAPGFAEGQNQEKGHNSVEEKVSEEKELVERSPTVEAGDMGITQSLDMPESSNVESSSQGTETDAEEEDGCGDLIESEEVREESKEPPDVNPDGDTPLDSSHQNLVENEMHACRGICDKTGDPGTHKLVGDICEKITCNVGGSRDLDSSVIFDQEEANEEFQESLEMPYMETDGDQQNEELRDATSRISVAEDESILHLREVIQDVLPVEQPILSIEGVVFEGSEFDGQKLSSSSVLQTELGPEPGSSTATSEDILEPEDLEVLLGSGCEGTENVQGNQEDEPICEAQASAEYVLESAISADTEKVNLQGDSSQDSRQDMTSNNGVMQGTAEIDLLEEDAGVVFVNTDESGDQRVLVDPSDILAKSNEFGISEESLAVNAEDLFGVSVHSDHVDGALHVPNALDEDGIIVPYVCPEQAQANLDPVSQETEAVRPMGEEDLLKESDARLEDQMDYQKTMWPDIMDKKDAPVIHRDKDALCSSVSQKRHNLSTESSQYPEFHTCNSETVTFRDSGSDTDGFLSPDTGEDNIFRKGQEAVGGGDSTSEVSVSCSSTDDTASVGHPSTSAESSEEVRHGGEAEEEAKDRLTEVPLPASLFRSTVRSLSPLRRHSWGAGKNQGGEEEMNQHSSVRRTGEEKPVFYRRSLSWCPSEPCRELEEIRELISYSLEGLAAGIEDGKRWIPQSGGPSTEQRGVQRQESEERGSLMSLTEEGPESDLGECSSPAVQKSRKYHQFRHSGPSVTLPLTKSVSMLSISQRDIDVIGRIRRKRQISFTFNLSPILPKSKTVFAVTSSSSDEEDIISMTSFTSTTSSMGYSITEEEPGPLRGDFEKSTTKVSRTFSYLKNKMYKKAREKEKEKNREKDREAKEREKKSVNGHVFSTSSLLHPALCQQCNKTLNTKDTVSCTNCNVRVHKSCRENIPVCPKSRMKFAVPESTNMPTVTLRTKSSTMRERPWSAIFSPEEHSVIVPSRRPTSIMPFHSSNLSKSMSINNIPMFDDVPLRGMRYLSQSTDSLHKPNKVTASNESLDEGTVMVDSRLMGEFEADVKELEADSWSITVDKKYLKQLKKDAIKRQDVIYELIQTEMHHLRTLRIMSDVYCKGVLTDLQLEVQMVEKMFPMLDELLELHSFFFNTLLERKKEAKLEGTDGFIINRIGDVLLSQFSDSNAESMKKIYGKFCSRHSEAVNFYKELHSRDRRFQAFIRKKMSSSVVRRLGIPECILLVTQRITKYPVLLQRILLHTKENEKDFEDLTQALQLVKDIIASVDSKVNEHEKKKRLKDIYGRTDSKSITRMKSGQMFAREDLLRSRRLLHDGPLQLKNAAGRLKDVHALLLSDVFVFLQEKDQKYVFASLDQRATVISLQKLIVREVAHEERGLFLITAGIANPEMVEVHASSREERNTWMQLIQDAMHSIEKDDDEGIPSETEEDRKLLETKTKEMRDMLQRKDEQIVSLLLEKMKLFREMCGSSDDTASAVKMLFRANNKDVPKGEPIMMDALREVQVLQALVNSSLGGAVGQQVACAPGNMGPVCLPRRAETFGGFDSHQMNMCKHGDKEEAEDLRRTESDSVLKKGGNANLLLLLKRNSEQTLTSVTHLHDLLTSLQAVVLQQDTFIEDQRQALNERTPSRSSSRPPSLVEQEKQRSLERHRQEAATLQRQQAVHAEEKWRKEREWDVKEQELTNREVLLHVREEETQRRNKELEEVQQELQGRKEDYQRDLERLRDIQRRLEREREQLQREVERVEHLRGVEARLQRTPSSTSEDSIKLQSSSSIEREIWEGDLSSSPRKNSLSRMDSKQKGRSFFSLGGKTQSLEGQNQIPTRLLQLASSKEKKDKKKKKSKSQPPQDAASHLLPLTEPSMDGDIFFC
ncbi:A-kinase anchor protein 13-like isoform X4 [Sinocyclocheilus anshuiensis]|uniref:A-kinase anchor protein 13-like isoform X4 n=1 Tax=Sinocyclocheilus anshuiensis TaxID=1608454 RepID=UPI0007B8766B|nr:PREDICTED: A-kinase anchor protein 13-like isoform X4 [Sinocyclocheilus anshuiensis]